MNLREIAVRERDTNVVVFKDTAVAVDRLSEPLLSGTRWINSWPRLQA